MNWPLQDLQQFKEDEERSPFSAAVMNEFVALFNAIRNAEIKRGPHDKIILASDRITFQIKSASSASGDSGWFWSDPITYAADERAFAKGEVVVVLPDNGLVTSEDATAGTWVALRDVPASSGKYPITPMPVLDDPDDEANYWWPIKASGTGESRVFTVVSQSGDTITCTDSETDEEVDIAVPFLCRLEGSDPPHDATLDQDATIDPPYEAGDQIVAVQPANGNTGVTDVDWIDTSARRWTYSLEVCKDGTTYLAKLPCSQLTTP